MKNLLIGILLIGTTSVFASGSIESETKESCNMTIGPYYMEMFRTVIHGLPHNMLTRHYESAEYNALLNSAVIAQADKVNAIVSQIEKACIESIKMGEELKKLERIR